MTERELRRSPLRGVRVVVLPAGGNKCGPLRFVLFSGRAGSKNPKNNETIVALFLVFADRWAFLFSFLFGTGGHCFVLCFVLLGRSWTGGHLFVQVLLSKFYFQFYIPTFHDRSCIRDQAMPSDILGGGSELWLSMPPQTCRRWQALRCCPQRTYLRTLPEVSS